MAFIPQARASALPQGDGPQLTPSPRRRVRDHAAEHGRDTAFLVGALDDPEPRSWAQVADTVERAAAGLIRSGLRADQVVVSLLPSQHGVPELDVALSAVGAVVVHVSPEITPDHLTRDLSGVDVRLVVCEDEADVQRLAGLPLGSTMVFALAGGRGWDRLLALGAERLVMDPQAVDRVDRMVDPAGTAARVIHPGAALGRVPAPGGEDRVGQPVPVDGVAVLCGDPADPFVQVTREAHLESGGTLLQVATVDDLPAAMAAAQPTVLALAPDAAAAVPGLLASVAGTDQRRRRPGRTRALDASALRAWTGGNLAVVVAPEVPDAVYRAFTGCGVRVVVGGRPALLPADLPVPPPVLVGDAADLPRRSRRNPAREFQLDADASDLDEPDASAFVLPSLPLIGGESFLDKLLISQARARA